MGNKVHPLADTATPGDFFVNPISVHDAALQQAGHASSSNQCEGAESPSEVVENPQKGRGNGAARPSSDLHHSVYAFCFTSFQLLQKHCILSKI